MTQRDDFLSVLKMDECDRIPFFPRDLTLGMDALNVLTSSVFGKTYNSELAAECVLALQKTVGHDAVVGCINSYGLEALGGETKYPDDGIPYLSKAPFDDAEKIEKHDPSEIRDIKLDGIRESYRIVREKRRDLAVVMNISGPMNTASNLRGAEQFIMDTAINPDIARKVVNFASEMMREMIDHIGFENTDCVFFASASDNPEMVGPKEFERYSLPVIRELTEYIHSNDSLSIFHPHGIFCTDDRRSLLKKCIDTGINGFQLAENNVPEGIVRETKDKCCILGGVDGFTTLILGNDERIKRDTMRFLDALGKENYIMTCSCSINRGIPIKSICTVAETVRKWKK